MARSNDVQYVRYYSYGSAAEKVELPAKERKKVTVPKSRLDKVQARLEKMDALALTGIVVAAVMLALMVVGLVQVSQANAQVAELEAYVANLEAENQSLQAQYDQGYNLAEIRVIAESMGMVPKDQVQHITIEAPEVVETVELTWWQQFIADMKALFA